MRILEHVLKVLMAIGVIAWVIFAPVITLNGVASGESLDGILTTLFKFTSLVGVSEGIVGVVLLILEEIGG